MKIPKIYKLDKELLDYKQINLIKPTIILALAFIMVAVLSSFMYKQEVKKVYVKAEQEVTLKNRNEFSREKLVQLIKELHIKHPEIVYTQFTFESGHFKSPLFKGQHNIMGMRLATTRPTTAIGEEGGYAVYRDWRDCVIDYALYQSSFLRGVNKEDYYSYLQDVYAENKDYTKEIKNYIKQNNVKQLFK